MNLGYLCRGRRILMSGHSDRGIFSSFHDADEPCSVNTASKPESSFTV